MALTRISYTLPALTATRPLSILSISYTQYILSHPRTLHRPSDARLHKPHTNENGREKEEILPGENSTLQEPGERQELINSDPFLVHVSSRHSAYE